MGQWIYNHLFSDVLTPQGEAIERHRLLVTVRRGAPSPPQSPLVLILEPS
jgi:hypothetical protein